MIHLRTLQALEYPKVIRLLASFCVSEQGRKEASAIAPLGTAEEARAALSLLDDVATWTHSPMVSKNPPDLAVPDVGPLLSAIDSHSVHPDTDSFWALRTVLTSAKNIRAAIVVPEGLTGWPGLYAMALERELPDILQKALVRCISDDATLRDESSAELHRIRNEIRSLHRNCLGRVREFATKYNILSYLQDEFMTISQDRYVLPLKATYKGRLQGILHDWSQTGETCYFEPMFLVTLNNRLQELKREERAEEMRVLDSLAAQVVGDRDRVENAVSLLTKLDVLSAKRRLADFLDATTVSITEESEGLHLINARHPLLVAQAKERNANSAHPLDICLRPGDQCLLLTGGNAGGKTVCLKTLGLVCAMTASGLPAPVDPGSHLFWIDRLDAFIGDEQDVEDHVSTFTAQIEHLAKAWKYLREKSLVLLDEFGAGTDPTHGAALAQAVLETLLDRGACVLAATHFPTLKIWAMATDHVRAASMLFDPKSKRPLFRLAYDQVGQSQTLTVARDHGLAPEVLARAEKILLLAGNDAADHLDRLNALTVERENEVKKLQALQKKTEADAKNKIEKLEKARREITTDLSQAIADLMQKVKSNKMQAKEALAELKAKRAKLRLEEKADEPQKPSVLGLADLRTGDRVRHTALNRTGTVTDVDERKERVRVDLGGISLWATLDVLAPAVEGKHVAAARPAMQDGFSLEIDVRGMTSDEAVQAIERFLDKNTLAGLRSVAIVHGRGTGVLRKAVHTYLKTYPGIESFALAPEDEGGDGKTLVTFA